jgi:uncharacterized protein Usg
LEKDLFSIVMDWLVRASGAARAAGDGPDKPGHNNYTTVCADTGTDRIRPCGAGNSGQSLSMLPSPCRSAGAATARDEGGQAMNRRDLARQLIGWRQTTAEILYRMPDHPALVQTFLWQDMDQWHDDLRLTFPRLRRFCAWWNANLDGPIVQVRVAALRVVTAGEMRYIDAEMCLH